VIENMDLREDFSESLPGRSCGCHASPGEITNQIRRLQVFTLLWMAAECTIALDAAWRARSPVLLAFGADSFVEFASALVVILQFVPRFTLDEARASRLAGLLLYVLAVIIVFTSAYALWRNVRPETSWLGIGVSIAALVVMPLLSRAKRRAGKASGNIALNADAVQSATCAYLAGVTLAGLGLNATLHVRWVDPTAALVAVPIIYLEGRRAWRGETCC
jgi:hypothetical protein